MALITVMSFIRAGCEGPVSAQAAAHDEDSTALSMKHGKMTSFLAFQLG